MQFRRLFFAGSLAVILAAPLISSDDVPVPPQERRVAPRRHMPMQFHQKRDQTASETYNWSGYAVTGSTGSVTQVQASWMVPEVSCSVTSKDGPNVYAAFWTGIDGWTSSTVEQIGTDSDCTNLAGTAGNTPTYYAWYEFYPQDAYLIGNYTRSGACESQCVQPGDTMNAVVSYTGTVPSGGHSRGGPQFSVTIQDVTQGWSFTTSSTVPNAQQSSAEWIAEAPYGCKTRGEFCYLSDFGSVSYSGSNATVNGDSGPISSFNSVQAAIMVDYPSGTTTMAEPTALSGEDFSVTWLNAGP